MSNNSNDPQYATRARQVADEFAIENYLRANDPKNNLQVIRGNHVPIAWRAQDGETLCVVLESGPKLYAPILGKVPQKSDKK